MIVKRSLGKNKSIHIDMDGIFLLVVLDLPNEIFLTSFSYQTQCKIISSQAVKQSSVKIDVSVDLVFSLVLPHAHAILGCN